MDLKPISLSVMAIGGVICVIGGIIAFCVPDEGVKIGQVIVCIGICVFFIGMVMLIVYVWNHSQEETSQRDLYYYSQISYV